VKALWSGGSTDGLPNLSVAQFCQKYCLSEGIRNALEDYGCSTAGALFEVSEGDLKDAGFKGGHIAELRRALKQFVAKYPA
jgi:hypothetical protein